MHILINVQYQSHLGVVIKYLTPLWLPQFLADHCCPAQILLLVQFWNLTKYNAEVRKTNKGYK